MAARSAAAPRPLLVEHGLAEGLVAAALLGWWASARGLPEFVLPGPVAVGSRLLDLFVDPAFLAHSAGSPTPDSRPPTPRTVAAGCAR